MSDAKAIGPHFHRIELGDVEAPVPRVFRTRAEAIEWIAKEQRFWRIVGTAAQTKAQTLPRRPQMGSLDAQLNFFSDFSTLVKNASTASDKEIIDAVELIAGEVRDKGRVATWIQPFVGIAYAVEHGGDASLAAAGLATLLYFTQDSTNTWQSDMQVFGQTDYLTYFRAMQMLNPLPWEFVGDGSAGKSAQGEIKRLRKSLAAGTQEITDQMKILTDLQSTLSEKIATEKPVELWRKRGKYHDWFAMVTLGSFVLCMALLTWALYYFTPNVFAHFSEIAPDVVKANPLLPLVGVTVPTLLWVWLMRLVSRNHSHHMMRRADAEERVALISAYYALLADTKTAPTESERLLVMQALFRPGPGEPSDLAPQDTILDRLANWQKGGS